MGFFKNLFSKPKDGERNNTALFSVQDGTGVIDLQGWRFFSELGENTMTATKAMRLSAVSACVEIRSDTIGKLPFYVQNIHTKLIDESNTVTRLLRMRPNEIMTPFTFKKLLETWRLLNGNAYVYIARDKKDGNITDLIPLDPSFVSPELDEYGHIWYRFMNGKVRRLIDQSSILHLKGFSDDGIVGRSVLSRASDKLNAMQNQELFQSNFYQNSANPSGVLTVDSDLNRDAKGKIRVEWQRIYGGADNAFKIAILDHGLQYQPITVSQKDSQFIETTEASIADIARYFLVPLYKLQAGKQTYNSNEQNSIEYVKTTIAPTVKQYEEEFTYKCLFSKDVEKGNEVVINMNAEMRGDQLTRAKWYNTMRNIGAYSVDDIRGYEDLTNVPGGDVRIMPLNSIPLEMVNDYIQFLMDKGMKNSKDYPIAQNDTDEEEEEEEDQKGGKS